MMYRPRLLRCIPKVVYRTTLCVVLVLGLLHLPGHVSAADDVGAGPGAGVKAGNDAPVAAAAGGPQAKLAPEQSNKGVAQPKLPVDKDAVIAADPYGKLVDDKGLVDLGFIHAFVASLSVIIVSELGDKTFFIAAIMAMRHSRLTIYLGAMGALGFMTVMSAILGYATTVIPRWFTYYASSGLFAIFGLKMMKEGYSMSPDLGKEEMEEAQADIRKKEEESEGVGTDIETGVLAQRRRWLYSIFSKTFLQAFTLTFLAEWGDRSQISTIILAARDEVIGVIIGGTLGHAICTGLAVIGGRFIAQKISLKTVHYIGGVVFIIFALSAFIIQPDD